MWSGHTYTILLKIYFRNVLSLNVLENLIFPLLYSFIWQIDLLDIVALKFLTIYLFNSELSYWKKGTKFYYKKYIFNGSFSFFFWNPCKSRKRKCPCRQFKYEMRDRLRDGLSIYFSVSICFDLIPLLPFHRSVFRLYFSLQISNSFAPDSWWPFLVPNHIGFFSGCSPVGTSAAAVQ